ncbi:insulinase family protein [Candidatus Saccharibacteria bacterium]|nr:insulinase family protein [Candidatus Saccharibacteria bacterium]
MKHTVHELKLGNGTEGLVIDVPGATVASYQIHFRAGNRYVARHDAYEAAHVMEHMAFGANAQFSDTHAYEADFTKNGAYHNAYTSDISMVYVADCADFEWERILDLKRVAICSPRFNAEELEAERGNVRNELTGYLNQHGRLLWPRVQQALGEQILTFDERLKRLDNVTLQDIMRHYKETHTRQNMRFVVAGKFGSRLDDVRAALERWDLGEGQRMQIPHEELSGNKPFIIRRKEASNITFGWAMVAPRRLEDPQLEAMACVDHILTGTLHSKILGKARKAGLAYGMFSDASAYQYDSAWEFGGQVNIDTADRLFDIMVDEVRAILDGKIDDDDIEAAKQYALGKHQMGCQTVGHINSWYADRYFFDGTIEDFSKRPAAIRAITKSAMVETVREFASANRWVLGAVGSVKLDDVNRLNDKLATLFA